MLSSPTDSEDKRGESQKHPPNVHTEHRVLTKQQIREGLLSVITLYFSPPDISISSFH